MKDYVIVVMNEDYRFDCVWSGIYTSDEANELIEEMKIKDMEKGWVYNYRKYYFITQRDRYFKNKDSEW